MRAAPQGRDGKWSCFDGVYCINLDQRPERWSYMQRQFEELGMPVQRWSAVDGRSLDVHALEALVEGGELSKEAVPRLLLPDDQKVFGLDLTPGAIGCALSHMQIWIDIMWRHGNGEFKGNDRPKFLVAEDDCQFLPGFCEEYLRERLAEVPDDWQVVFLGGVDALGLQPLLQISPGVRRVYNGSRETTAYMMNIDGVRTALNVCFPLMWQLDTQLTLQGRACVENPELVYTVKPMSYIFWPPLVEQNKEDFTTDVQKDEHPRYLHGRNGANCYSVKPETWVLPGNQGRGARTTSDQAALANSYALVGNWNDWTTFLDFSHSNFSADEFTAELNVPVGQDLEFQVVCDNDWNQRIFPAPGGGILLGPSAVAHGHNWKLQVPLGPPQTLHVVWDPTGERSLDFSLGEPTVVALSRTYALVGSWNSWTFPIQLERKKEEDGAFTAIVEVPAGQDVEFQIICDGEWNQCLFPARDGGGILGPSGDSHGRNWKIEAPRERSLLRVRWNPVGRRSLRCSLGEVSKRLSSPQRRKQAPRARKSEPSSRRKRLAQAPPA